MNPASPDTHDEAKRLACLRNLEILDTPPEPLFDGIVAAARAVCGTSIALISLVDAERQWFKANVGLEGVTETPRDIAFCAHTIHAREVLVVEDAHADARFRDSPLVTGDPHIRFYAGAPIALSDGSHVGTLCVIDPTPGTLSGEQRTLLAGLARTAAAALELRATMQCAFTEFAREHQRVIDLYESPPAMLHSVDRQARMLAVSDTWLANLGYTREEVIGRSAVEFMTPESARFAREEAWPQFFASGRATDLEYQYVRKDGSVIDVLVNAVLERDAHGAPLRTLAVLQDVTARKHAERRLLRSRYRLRAIIDGTNVGTWEWNVQTGELRINERWAEIIGYRVDELEPLSIGTWLRLAHPDDLRVSQELLESHLAGTTDYYDSVVRMRHRDGHWVWVHDRGRVSDRDADGRPLWMMGTHADITAQKEIEQSLNHAKLALERTERIARVGGWEIDLATGALSIDEQMRCLFDLEPDAEVRLDALLALQPPESRAVIAAALESAQHARKPYDFEIELHTARDRRMWVRVTGNAEPPTGTPLRLVGAMQDISRRYEAERALAESRELLEVTLESIADGVITTDLQGRVQWLNPVAARLTGWSSAQARGRDASEIFRIVDEETRQPATSPVARCVADQHVRDTADHTLLLSRDGTEYAIEESASAIRDRDGEARGVVIVFRDVTAQRRLSHEMRHRATHDTLTGLVNRAEFETRMAQVLDVAAEGGTGHALMYIDLDQFKIVNDSCGHTVGDHLLKQVATLLAARVRKRDTLARLGGDEFGVILEHCTTEQAGRVAQQICDDMDVFRFVHDGKPYRIGASIGLVPIDARLGSLAAVMKAADSACYAAKEAGRNRLHLWRDGDRTILAHKGHMQWAQRIEHALDEDRFELYGQKIFALRANGPYLHCEVLLRMRDEDGEQVMPGAFFPAAERYNLASRLDRWVLRKLFELLSSPGNALERYATIAVNVSGQSIGDQAFHRYLGDLITGAPFDVSRVSLELTETAVVTQMASAVQFIGQMKELGIRVALDDFGAGASSFGYLKQLPISCLKIDGQFVRDIETDRFDLAAVRCFVEVAGVMGIPTVAEHVQSQPGLACVRALGVDYAQGFLLHKPQPLVTLDRSIAPPVCLASRRAG